MRLQSISRIILCFFLALGVSTCFAADINWQTYSKSSFAKAKKEHRLVLLFGKASWCPWCRRMKSETYSNNSVIELVNKYYIPVMVDIDDEASIADKYNISSVPTVIILDGDYKIVDSKAGFQDVSDLVKMLQSNAKASS